MLKIDRRNIEMAIFLKNTESILITCGPMIDNTIMYDNNQIFDGQFSSNFEQFLIFDQILPFECWLSNKSVQWSSQMPSLARIQFGTKMGPLGQF